MKIGDKVKCIKLDARLTIGEVYTIRAIGGYQNRPTLYTDELGSMEYYQDHFELVELVMTVEEQVNLAKSLLGKEVFSKLGTRIVVEDIEVFLTKKRAYSSTALCGKAFDKDGFAVVVKGCGYTVVVKDVVIPPDHAIVKLNDNYDAKITKDTIEVGCQTFPISILDELVAALKKL